MTTWFVSDNHFSHKNIRKFCPNTRQGADVDEMDRLMIRRWQEQVQPGDTVWTLGDVFFCNSEKSINILRQLPGEIHHVWGNHDKVISSNATLRNMFKSHHDYMELNMAEAKVVLFHFPIYEWNRMHHGAYHLFGHVHGGQLIPGRALDVGIDGELSQGDMSLYSWEQVHRFLSKKEVRTHHGKMAGVDVHTW